MSIMSERNRIEMALDKYNIKTRAAVIQRIENFKTFANLQYIDDHLIDYIVYNELEKVLKEETIEDIKKMDKKSGEYRFMNGLKGLKGIGFILAFIVVTFFASTLKAEEYNHSFANDAGAYIDLSKCNDHSKGWYTVCWDDENRVPVSGWTIIDSLLIDRGNLIKRPNFHKDGILNTMSPKDIKMPDERGHTFANDADNDYNKDALKSTYNMMNITPQLDKVNTGIWRKIETRGRFLAKQIGEVGSITLVEYNNTMKNGFKYPISYTRIYIGEDIEECYKVPNIIPEYKSISKYKIDCTSIRITK